MSQKLKDIITNIKTDRKYTVFALVAAGAMMFLFLSADPTPRRKLPKTPEGGQKVAALAQKEAYEDIVTRFQNDLQSLKDENKAARGESQELKKSMKDYEERTAQIFNSILKKMADQPGQLSGSNATSGAAAVGLPPRPIEVPGAQGDGLTNSIDSTSLSNQELESLWSVDSPQVAPPAPPPVEKVAFIGAGDSVRVKLLAGVNAPTDGTPYPVVFKLVSDVNGPDGSTLPIGEARVVAAAQGSLTDSRALFRITSLNIKLPDGRRKVVRADGWIVGEDGIRGMSGVLIDPIGKAIAGTGFSGFLQGVGQGISAANTTVTRNNSVNGTQTTTDVTGNVLSYAAGQGASNAAGEWSGIIRDRLSQMVPVVQVLSGREATAVFAKNVTISGLFNQLEDEDSNGGLSINE